jgi:hypothetical protein
METLYSSQAFNLRSIIIGNEIKEGLKPRNMNWRFHSKWKVTILFAMNKNGSKRNKHCRQECSNECSVNLPSIHNTFSLFCTTKYHK